VPLSELATKPEHLRLFEKWMKSYRPEELFDPSGKLIPEWLNLLQKDCAEWAQIPMRTVACF